MFDALKSNAVHVPFRNSKLTHLLQPCLSGDAKVSLGVSTRRAGQGSAGSDPVASVSLQCCVFVNVSPDSKNLAETLSSLQFGSSVRQVSLGKAGQNLNKALK